MASRVRALSIAAPQTHHSRMVYILEERLVVYFKRFGQELTDLPVLLCAGVMMPGINASGASPAVGPPSIGALQRQYSRVAYTLEQRLALYFKRLGPGLTYQTFCSRV